MGDNAHYHHPQDYFHKSTNVTLIEYHPRNLYLRCSCCYDHSYFFFFTVFCIQTVQTVCTFTSWGQKRAISSAATPHLCAYILHGSATVQTTVGTTQTRPTARVSTSTKTLVICWFRGNPSLITREISFFTVDWNKIYWGLEKIMSLCSARSQWSDVVVAFLSSFSWAEVRGRPLCLS